MNTNFTKTYLLLIFILLFKIANSQTTYKSQYLVNMPCVPHENLEEVYRYSDNYNDKMQQSFKLNLDDVNATEATIEHLVLSPYYWGGPNESDFNINIYEGTIDNLGTLIYTQPYNKEFLYVEAGLVTPDDIKLFDITGSLVLQTNKDYVLEIDLVNIEDTYKSFGFYVTDFDLGTSNMGDRDIYMKLYGSVTSTTDSDITLSNASASNYYLDTYSNFFATKLLNKYEAESIFVGSTKAGNLEYRSSNDAVLKVAIQEQETGVQDKIELMGVEDGKALVYIVHQNDTISHFNATVTTKKVIPISYQYIKYPGESDHEFLTAFTTITQTVGDIFNEANVTLQFTDQGIIEYEWDLDGDGQIWSQDYSEIHGAYEQVPNSESFFSNLILIRRNKDDDDVGGSNGDGTSQTPGGWAHTSVTPRYGLAATRIIDNAMKRAQTLAHELGHNLGLVHYSTSGNGNGIIVPNDLNNLMKTGRQENYIFNFQWDVIHKTIAYRAQEGENYETRPNAEITSFDDTSVQLNETEYQLMATTNSDAQLTYKVTSGDNITVDNNGKVTLIGEGVAQITVYAYATDNYLAASKTINFTVANTLGAEDVENSILKIYPNPSDGKVNINLNGLVNSTILVFDTRGRRVYQKYNLQAKTHKFNLKESAGVYIVKVITPNKVENFKLIMN